MCVQNVMRTFLERKFVGLVLSVALWDQGKILPEKNAQIATFLEKKLEWRMFYSYIGTKCQFLLKYKLTPVISTEGAFRRAVTYDNHPTHPHIALKTTSHELRRSKMH